MSKSASQTLFNLDPEILYLNHAAVAPWPLASVEAVKRFAEENGRLGASHYPRWMQVEQRLHSQLANLINAPSADDIAILKNTSEGLSVIAHGVQWKTGDNLISTIQEFPSNRIVWESLERQGVEIRKLDLSTSAAPENDLIALCDGKTKLISVSSVQYASGLRLNLDHLGEQCQNRNILFCVDAIQSLGAIPFDVISHQADFVVADGHKWMLGPEGVALFYCRPEIRDQLRLHQFGWHMVEHPGDFDRTDWQPASTARRFECGSPNMLGIHALSASLEVIELQGIENIQQRIHQLTEQIIEEVDRSGFELLSPRAAERKSGIVTFRAPNIDNQTLYSQLMDNKVICAHRGGGIRFSPHFHNSEDQIKEAFIRLQELI